MWLCIFGLARRPLDQNVKMATLNTSCDAVVGGWVCVGRRGGRGGTVIMCLLNIIYGLSVFDFLKGKKI